MTEGFARTGERVVHDGHLITVAVGSFTAPDGSSFERDIVHHPGAVSVVPLLPDGRVVMVRQYRAAIDQLLLEIPAGVRDHQDEPPEATAVRELAEEVGQAPGRLDLLARFYNTPGFSDEEHWVFLARDLREVDLDLQGVEEQHMTIEHVRLDDVVGLVARGEITDAKSIIGLALARLHLAGEPAGG